jgi:drug/metabolite transporter (DMT)-like permease
VLGLALAAGYQLQTFGLRSTPAAISGFLTGLGVVFTPLLAWALLRHRPGYRAWAGSLLATGGLALISLRAFSFGAGELLTLASAVVFAAQIVGLGRWSTADGAWGLATVQLLTVAALLLFASLTRGGLGAPRNGGEWAAVAGTAVAATALAFAVQSWAQSQISTARTAVTLTMEPVFAALAAWVAGETFEWTVLAGGALVVAAMLVVEPPVRRKLASEAEVRQLAVQQRRAAFPRGVRRGAAAKLASSPRAVGQGAAAKLASSPRTVG